VWTLDPGSAERCDGSAQEKKKKDADSVHTTGMDKEKDVVLCSSAPPNGCRDTTSHSRIKIREAFRWGSNGWEAEACTPPGVLL